MSVLYLCNGNEERCKKTYCWKNGGKCRHTKDKNARLIGPDTTIVEVGKDKWEMTVDDVKKMIGGEDIKC